MFKIVATLCFNIEEEGISIMAEEQICCLFIRGIPSLLIAACGWLFSVFSVYCYTQKLDVT